MHIYNSFFLVPTLNIHKLAFDHRLQTHDPRYGNIYVAKYPVITATFALPEARTYDQILMAFPTIEKFFQQWEL